MSNYNILLACPSQATSVLCSAATIMWPWDALVKGEFSPKFFNYPPDGLFGSWYGHYKGSLDDPFKETASEEPIMVSPDTQQSSMPSSSKHCSIPKDVTNAIVETLELFPDGISISYLRMMLKRNMIDLGTDYFGHKKFSSLLQSMSDMVKFVSPPPGEDQLFVAALNKGLQRPSEQNSKILSSAQSNARKNNLTQKAQNDKTHSPVMSTRLPELNSKPLDSSQSIDRNIISTKTVTQNPPKLAVSSSQSDVLSGDQKKCPTVDVDVQTESPANCREVGEKTVPRTPSSSWMENPIKRNGLLKRIWILFNGSDNVKSEISQNSEGTSSEVIDDLRTRQEHNIDPDTKLMKSICKMSSRNGRSDGPDSRAAANANLSNLSGIGCSETIKRDSSIIENSEPCREPTSISVCNAGKRDDTSEMNEGLFSWASRWWTFGKSDADRCATNRNDTDEVKTYSIEESESSDISICGSGQQVVNEIFTKSHFWDVLVQQLLKPPGSEIVMKAKTREELVHGLQKLDCWPIKGLPEKDLQHLVHLLVSEKKWIEESSSQLFPFRLTLPHKRTCIPSNSSKYSGPSSVSSNTKPQQCKNSNDNSKKSRSLTREEILSDCHKLLNELLLQYEYGFNISIFKARFTQKHGYNLDHQKLGYPDLESLLQIMPGARIKFPRVLRAENVIGESGVKGSGNRNSGDDFIWEELGPISVANETATGKDKELCYRPPTPSDDEFSDNDTPAGQQPRRDADQSSLLQIINSWNRNKDDHSSKKPQDIDGLVDCSRSSQGSDNQTAGSVQRSTGPPQKKFLFVSDSEEDKEKDKLVESVLGSLQKARVTKLQN